MGWKEAASLMLMSLKEKPYTSLFNYKILMLKRSDKSSFLPNAYVFPGGAVDTADANPKWLTHFLRCGVPLPCLSSVVPQENLPPIFKGDTADVLQKHISLRVTAIRETFEETGVLLCRRGINDTSVWADVMSLEEFPSWRQQVQKQPEKFLEMCESLECVPDIWALKLWSNWQTPPDFQKRFDTVFFTACLPQQPESIADNTEIDEATWYSPDRLLRLSSLGNLWLPPPQFYELSRLMRFCMLEDTAQFSSQRENRGCERYDSSRLKTREGLIFPMPGDDTYGETNEDRFSDCDFTSARALSKYVHRIEVYKNGRCNIAVVNAIPTYGHILPFIEERVLPSQCCRNK